MQAFHSRYGKTVQDILSPKHTHHLGGTYLHNENGDSEVVILLGKWCKHIIIISPKFYADPLSRLLLSEEDINLVFRYINNISIFIIIITVIIIIIIMPDTFKGPRDAATTTQ